MSANGYMSSSHDCEDGHIHTVLIKSAGMELHVVMTTLTSSFFLLYFFCKAVQINDYLCT